MPSRSPQLSADLQSVHHRWCLTISARGWQGSLADMAQHDMPPPAEAQGPVSMAASRVVMHQIVLPSEVDALGICFGGQVRAWHSS